MEGAGVLPRSFRVFRGSKSPILRCRGVSEAAPFVRLVRFVDNLNGR
jgi:hypothetical protein